MLQLMRREGVKWLIANEHAALWDGMTVGQLAFLNRSFQCLLIWQKAM